MAGTFTIGQTKARPGIYWRRENAGGVSLAGAINGIGVGIIRANWGPLNKAVDFEPNTDVKKIFGSGNTEDLITEMFNGGISSGKFVRIGKGGTAPSVKLTLADGNAEAGTITGAYVGKGAAEDGKSVGSSFIQGFKDGFDTEKIGEALKTWASNNKEIVVGLGVVLGGKLIAGIAKGVRQGKNLYSDLKNILGKGSNSSTPGTGGGMAPSTYTTTTMTVTASVVNVYGNTLNNGRSTPSTGGSGGGSPLLLPGSGMAGRALLGGGGTPALPGGGAPLGLPGATGGGGAAAAAGGLTSATGWLGKLLQLGSSSSVIGADGTLLSVSGGVGGTLGGVAGALGSGASTAAGAAAVGGGSILGAIGGLVGIGSGIWDFFKGSKKEGKEAKDDYFSGGTKIGMVGAGAGIEADLTYNGEAIRHYEAFDLLELELNELELNIICRQRAATAKEEEQK